VDPYNILFGANVIPGSSSSTRSSSKSGGSGAASKKSVPVEVSNEGEPSVISQTANTVFDSTQDAEADLVCI
jgi:hypothetical protein